MTDGTGTIGVIVAGGRSSRMGGNEKAFLALAERPMIQVALDRLRRQTDTVIINANGDPERMAFLGVPIQKDIFGGFAGPLAGVHAGMQWVRHNQPKASHICTIAADTPFFPADLAARLEDSCKTAGTIVLAASNGFRHPVFGLWPVSLIEDLAAFLQSGQTGKVMAFVKQHDWTEAEFDNLNADGNSIDPFFNINTPDELELARQLQEQIDIDE
ncbi:MAG: molybdenum cofactor guanylyltransferase MobA [Pseudomonadota bacterium]